MEVVSYYNLQSTAPTMLPPTPPQDVQQQIAQLRNCCLVFSTLGRRAWNEQL